MEPSQTTDSAYPRDSYAGGDINKASFHNSALKAASTSPIGSNLEIAEGLALELAAQITRFESKLHSVLQWSDEEEEENGTVPSPTEKVTERMEYTNSSIRRSLNRLAAIMDRLTV